MSDDLAVPDTQASFRIAQKTIRITDKRSESQSRQGRDPSNLFDNQIAGSVLSHSDMNVCVKSAGVR
jgi:hypothetical protein